LIGCIIQFVVEITLNETLECLWVNCFVPSLVTDEVREVSMKLAKSIDLLCGVSKLHTNRAKRFFLDAPAYLFVSTNVAMKFPELLESMIIRSFSTHLPGPISYKWKFEHRSWTKTVTRVMGMFQLRTIHTRLLNSLLYGLQLLGASPFVFQRVFIRLAQPWFLASLTTAIYYIGKNKVALALTVISFAIVLSYIVRRCYVHAQQVKEATVADEETKRKRHERKESRRSKGDIRKVHDTGALNLAETHEDDDDSDNEAKHHDANDDCSGSSSESEDEDHQSNEDDGKNDVDMDEEQNGIREELVELQEIPESSPTFVNIPVSDDRDFDLKRSHRNHGTHARSLASKSGSDGSSEPIGRRTVGTAASKSSTVVSISMPRPGLRVTESKYESHDDDDKRSADDSSSSASVSSHHSAYDDILESDDENIDTHPEDKLKANETERNSKRLSSASSSSSSSASSSEQVSFSSGSRSLHSLHTVDSDDSQSERKHSARAGTSTSGYSSAN
jgi:hypothetical protein